VGHGDASVAHTTPFMAAIARTGCCPDSLTHARSPACQSAGRYCDPRMLLLLLRPGGIANAAAVLICICRKALRYWQQCPRPVLTVVTLRTRTTLSRSALVVPQSAVRPRAGACVLLHSVCKCASLATDGARHTRSAEQIEDLQHLPSCSPRYRAAEPAASPESSTPLERSLIWHLGSFKIRL